VQNLASVDWLILSLFLFFSISIGFALKPFITSSKEFLQAGRAMPAWICGLAFFAASLGSQEVIGMGAAGARYGLASVAFYSLGAIPAMLFVGLFMMPLYYGSGARSVPEFLRLRFDEKTRTLNACLFAGVTAFAAGISLYAMARLAEALHVFEPMFAALHLGPQASLIASMALPAAIVLLYILLGGLAATMYNLVLQFFVLVAGLLPMVLLGLKQIGGWNGLHAIVPTNTYPTGSAQASGHAIGLGGIALAMGLGIVLGAGYWCTDFRVVQTAMAAKDAASAKRAPLIAAAFRIFLPLLLILPGLIAIALPTPHTTVFERIENGTIYHEITVVPPAAEAGRGLVPARTDSATDPEMGNPLLDAHGHALLNYNLATPEAILHFLPGGLLGLGLAALLACLMSGVAVNISALTTVFTCDLYQPHIRKNASDEHYLAVARWAAVGAVLLSVSAGCAAMRLHGILDALALAFALVNAPLLATFLLGMFWKRATGHGAFAGLIAGTAAAVLHQGLTLPVDANPGLHGGLHGGWIAAIHRYPSDLTQCFWTAVIAFAANLIVTVAVSLCTQARPEAELAGLVHSLTPRLKTASTMMHVDVRIPIGMMFSLAGTILTAFGLAIRKTPELYAKSLGIDATLWWGIVVLAFGLIVLTLGRRGQMRIERERPLARR
jgi:SSS family solute:Na+ symporter